MPQRLRNLALLLASSAAIGGIAGIGGCMPGRTASAQSVPQTPGLERIAYPAHRDVAPVAGIVVDAQCQPVAGAKVVCEPTPGCVYPQPTIGEDRSAPPPVSSDANGAFHFPEVPHGPWHLRAVLADGRVGELALAVPQQGPPKVLRVDIARHSAVVPVRVTDPQGQPVAGARVVAFVVRDADSILAADQTPDVVASSDATGDCHLALPALPWVMQATAPDGRAGIELGEPRRYQGGEHVRLVVDAVGGVDGVLVGVDSRLLVGSSISALRITHADSLWAEVHGLRWTASVQDGAFAFRSLPVGLYAWSLQAPSGVCLQFSGAEVASPARPTASAGKPCTTVVAPDAVVNVALPVQLGGTLSGCVRTDLGVPIPGARVEARLLPRSVNRAMQWVELGRPVWQLFREVAPCRPHPSSQTSAVTDADGHYDLRGLQAGEQRLEVHAAGRCFEPSMDVVVTLGETSVQDFALAAAGVLQGVVSDWPYGHLAVLPLGSEQPVCLAVLPAQGTFTLPGIAAGDWTLARWSNGRSGQRITPLANVHVTAGRTTWVDLRQPASVHFSGRVVDANGNPVAGVVDLHPDRQVLQPDGAFAFERQEPLQPQLPGSFEVWTGGRQYLFAIPEAAIGAKEWRGEFRLGPCELQIALLDPQGQPRAGAVWLTGPGLSGGTFSVPAEAVVLRHLRAGSYTLSAQLPGVLVTPQTVELPQTSKVVLATRPAARIEVQVLDAEARPWPYAPVELYRGAEARPVDRVRESWSARADADGIAHLQSDPGPYWVALEPWARSLYPGIEPIPVEAKLDAPARVTMCMRPR